MNGGLKVRSVDSQYTGIQVLPALLSPSGAPKMTLSSLRKALAFSLIAVAIGVASLASISPAQAGDVSVRFGFGAPVYDDYLDDGFVDYRLRERRHVRPRYAAPSRHAPRYVYERPARYRTVCRVVPTRVWDDYEDDWDIVNTRRCRRVARW
jgi:hypothetical protein